MVHSRPWTRVGRRRLLIGAGLMPIVAFAAFTAMLTGVQSRLIFPGQVTQGRPEAQVEAPPGTELVTLETRAGDRIVALFGPALTADARPQSDAEARPTILFFYGNGMCLASSLDIFDLFRKLGANVLIADYTGYGMSGGQAGEAGCYATADAAWSHLRARSDVHPDRIIVAGWSLGAAVAADLAAREPVAGLALFSAFTSMADMAKRALPFVPSGLLLRHRFETLSKLPRVLCPVLIGHGREDRLIPYAMSDRLAAACEVPVTRFTVEKADHNEFFAVGEDLIGESLGRLVEDVATPR